MVDITLEDLPVYISAVGALGIAAFGIVDAVGKTVFVFDIPWVKYRMGLPFVGYSHVRALMRKVAPALQATYGDDYERIIREQYRAGRGYGQAPESIRQGVRLGLPFLPPEEAGRVIGSLWGLGPDLSFALGRALAKGDSAGPTRGETTAEALNLAGRFATALDTKVQAAFDVAEQMYQARAQFWAGVTAVALSLAFQFTLTWEGEARFFDLGAWMRALIIGLAAVPLAPIAKDLASKLTDALGALKQLNAKSR